MGGAGDINWFVQTYFATALDWLDPGRNKSQGFLFLPIKEEIIIKEEDEDDYKNHR